ncbi:NAD(P)H-dependent oxidoreductase [Rhodococcus sp. JVH1]|uniref:NAD(P)H-dependent oxidoreductase n=1 Tax=Rhodococcus sp. JVH1 TaxID=745408 RepID=UPI000272134C|nr:NAD(P)H-dependent oxidoreductase [Rhodococcus sp. JVH1]EJI95746.1 flavodoxin-like fold family protein [Rhodococcus sp. JVH1]
MSKVLVIVGHPNLATSRHNAALVAAIGDLDHVTVHDLYRAYPDFRIDVAAEQALVESHEVVIFQHPVHWYNLPPLVRQWQDDVLTHGWAFAYDGTTTATAGKKALVAVTCGGSLEDYSLQGRNRHEVDVYLSNWISTLMLCQFDIQESFQVHGAGYGISDDELNLAAKRYRELVSSFL